MLFRVVWVSMKLSPKQIAGFQKTIRQFYEKGGRRFPWRPPSSATGGLRKDGTGDPYAILVSEVMLQQTQAERVIPKYLEWMKRFPTLESLAKASVADVLKKWQGLGYNRRALNLKRAAEILMRDYGGVIPQDIEKIDVLPGVGPYTAGAVVAFAFNIPSVLIETNIRTVYLHFFFKNRSRVVDSEILELIAKTLPTRKLKVQPLSRFEVEPLKIREWYSALMDYGAMLKKTEGNTNVQSAQYTTQSKFKGSRRQLRGAILRKAATQKSVRLKDFSSNTFSVLDVVTELVREGFLRKDKHSFTLA